MHLVVNKAQAALNTANKAYEAAIEADHFFDEVLTAIPVEDVAFYFYHQVVTWRDQAVKAVSATYHAKRAAEEMLEEAQKRYR